MINSKEKISKNKHHYFNTMLSKKSRFVIVIILIIFIINENSLAIVYLSFIFNVTFETTKFFIANIIKFEIKR